MQLNIAGSHLEVTPALREYVSDKMEGVQKRFNNITSIQITLGVDKLDQRAEATIHCAKAVLHAEANCADMYEAIDALAEKCKRQILKHKDKLSDKGSRTHSSQQMLDALDKDATHH